ncbi:MAG: hypothetical protein BWY35_01735 [Firmicutes bacterium ADurb.Bin248]|nr:MAG: hypothetical protein BWY35_01735 [Firmicutes bacterium ADurb.Bin248]
MKKLFSLVLALALALAIAAPALASGWDQIVLPSTPVYDITIQITALETTPNTSVLGSLYEPLKVMYPVINGTEVHFYVAITIPTSLSASNNALLASKRLEYRLDLDDITLENGQAYLDGGKVGDTFKNLNSFPGYTSAYAFDASHKGHVHGFEYWGKANKPGASGASVSASIGFYNSWVGGVFAWDNDADGVDEFLVTHTDGVYTISAVGTSYAISFPVVEATGKIDVTREIVFSYNSANYAITTAVNQPISFRNLATNAVVTSSEPTLYQALLSGFNAFFSALGFGYADAKYMTTAHFDKYFGRIASTSVGVTWPYGTVTTVVVAPPAVQPPQTGDATTVVGFVMIALALVAAAAVTVRKVRA